MRSNPPALAALPALFFPALFLLAACTATDAASPAPSASSAAPSASSPSLSPSAPSPGTALPSDPATLEQWAATALPENGLGGSTAVARGSGEVGPTGASAALQPVGGSWDVVVACESTTGAPLTVAIDGDTGTTTDVACGIPGESGASPTTIRWDATSAATLRLDSTEEAVFVYEVHPRAGT
ncbi:hypothetical protein [Microbacterium sp. RURRCA19A]|uniref:hypothetical protein n=1 Tax=Microbacterium sp. RURRCA19A TaxID=1907391 RepID=UPI0009546CDE|nr:hypothetical protein [Microbacterium sp. RURRCA19A]SIR99518.1 hypothetical protein SAMN05880568_2265 [Microbacterium sp. RURRCA19A]